jgi:D-3-phosphoglycerate dehydrogenase
MKIVVLDDFQDAVRHLEALAMLRERLPQAELVVHRDSTDGAQALVSRLRDADVLVLIRERTRLTREVIERLARLRVIVQTGRVARDGTAHIDLAACSERGIAIVEGESDGISAAELTWTLVLAARRRLPQYLRHLEQGRWQYSGLEGGAFPANFGIGVSLHGGTLGIWGYGRIGGILAPLWGRVRHEGSGVGQPTLTQRGSRRRTPGRGLTRGAVRAVRCAVGESAARRFHPCGGNV